MISQYLAWTILTLVFIAGCDQLYAMDPVIPLNQRQPSRKFRTNNQKKAQKQNSNNRSKSNVDYQRHEAYVQ